MKENAAVTRRFDLISKGIDPGPTPKDPALRIPKSRRLDTWANQTTGFGTETYHQVANTSYAGLTRISWNELEEMYRSDWVTRKGVDAPAEDMTRKGISYHHNDDDEDGQKNVEDFDDILNEQFSIWQTSYQAIALSRISGGSLTIFNTDDITAQEDFAIPLNENQVNDIRWVKTVPSWYAIPLTYYRDINHPKWGWPEHYQVIIREAGFGVTLTVHESRCIRMDGNFTTQTPRVQNRGWHDSIVQQVYTAIRDYGVCVKATNSGMESFTRDSMGMKGLADKTMMGDDDYVLNRVYLMHQTYQSGKIMIYDADSEEMKREGTPVQGLADLWDGYTEAICAGFSVPRSRFMSSESGALGGNAAVEDTRNYFDNIRSKQEIRLRPYLNKFFTFVNYAYKLLEELPDYSFNELQEESSKEKAETAYIVAQKDQIYLQEQVITPEEVAQSRFSKSEPDLETMNIDFEARAEVEKEMRDEEIEDLRNQLAAIQAPQQPIQQISEQPKEEKSM